MMDAKEYRRKLLAVGNPDEYDKWFDAIVYCLYGKNGCDYCSAYAENPPDCYRENLFGGKNPFCAAFKNCEECGIDCRSSRVWLQDMLDRCEEVGLFECSGADYCWKGDDCYTCNFVPCRECIRFQYFAMVCECGFDQTPWDCPYVIKEAA
jgi:hypothetical protein